ncbi:MAG: hypothetical protein ACRDKI_05155 [Solirubrobacterales bacterium]
MPGRSQEISYSEKLRGAEYLTAISGLILFITTFQPWFTMPGVDEIKQRYPDALLQGGGSSNAIHLNVWDLHFGRWFVYLAVLCAAWMVLAAIFSANPEWSVILATPTVFFSLVAMITLIYRLIDPPRASAEPTTIYYVAVAASIGLFAGACWAIRDEHVPPGFAKAPQPEVVNVDTDSAP